MSNRRKAKPTPPAAIAAYAAAYACGHCDSDTAPPRLDEHGMWHVDIAHDPTCPVLAGAVPKWHAGLRAARAAGQSALYVAGAVTPTA